MNLFSPSHCIPIPAPTLAPYANSRIDSALAIITGFSRTWIQKQIKAGRLTTTNGTVIDSCRLPPPKNLDLLLSLPSPNPQLSISPHPSQPPHPLLPESSFLYEDSDLIVVNKPPGLVVHPAPGHLENTLTHALSLRYGQHSLSSLAGNDRPGIVHRLDRDTSGLMIIARNNSAHHKIAAQFSARSVTKHYLAIVKGTLRKPFGSCMGNIGRHPIHRKKMAVLSHGGRSARTDYLLLYQAQHTALIRCHLHTGRTHQIRVHLAHLGHPILGDPLYGGRRAISILPQPILRQMLHAAHLAFEHPTTRAPMAFNAPPPEDFCALARALGIDQGLGSE